jgi:transcriptional regulator with XRE-family HTH domain
MAKGTSIMTFQPARWSEHKSDQILVSTAMNFAPEPLEEHRSTGIWVLLGHSGLITCIGSGSQLNVVVSHPKLRKENRLRKYSPSLADIVLSAEILEEETLIAATVVEKLNSIRDSFGFSMAALANILGASRASVYNWLEDETPTERFIQRIEKLYEIVQEWETKNPYHYAPGRLLKQKLGAGPSMFERLSHDELNLDDIRNGMDSLLVLMNKQRERMDRAKARSAKAPADTESHKEILERLTGSVTADSR